MDKWEKIKKFISYNRFLVIGPIVGILLWFYATSCTPETRNPTAPDQFINAVELKASFESWQADQTRIAALYEIAGEDLQQQEENNLKIQELIMGIATGGVADMPGLLKLIIGTGAIGAIGDNIRKRGLIQGLKRNKA